MARKVEFTFDPFDLVGEDKDGLSPGDIKTVMSDVADFVLTSVLDDTANQKSSVYGNKWDALSPKYAKIKKGKGKSPIPNLELEGDMLSSLRVIKRSKELTLTVSGGQGDKADGHCNHSGESKLPLRRFIPFEPDGDTFSKPIMKGISQIIRDAKAEADGSTFFQELVDKGLKITLKQEED